MRITALTVCVNYAQFLERSIQTWYPGLDDLFVITSTKDVETKELCRAQRINYFATDVFYDFGAAFNKGAAMSEVLDEIRAFQHCFKDEPLSYQHFNDRERSKKQFFTDWCLFIDADIMLPPHWKEAIELVSPQIGNLYGASRVLENGNGVADEELAGFFQLFHAEDRNAKRTPFLDPTWKHAGGYDSEFMQRWRPNHQKFLPLTVTHQGETGKNWHGIGREDLMQGMLDVRTRTGAIGKDERIRK